MTCRTPLNTTLANRYKLLRDELGKLLNIADLRIAKEQVKKPKIWILDSMSLMKSLKVLIKIPA